jgi:hypothetical protein
LPTKGAIADLPLLSCCGMLVGDWTRNLERLAKKARLTGSRDYWDNQPVCTMYLWHTMVDGRVSCAI